MNTIFQVSNQLDVRLTLHSILSDSIPSFFKIKQLAQHFIQETVVELITSNSIFYDKDTNIFVPLLLYASCICLMHTHMNLILYLDTMEHSRNKDYCQENGIHILGDGVTPGNIAPVRNCGS